MQQGTLIRSGRKRGPDVWQFRWADRGHDVFKEGFKTFP